MLEGGPGERSTERQSEDVWPVGVNEIEQRTGSQCRGGVLRLGQDEGWRGLHRGLGHSRRRGSLPGGGVQRGRKRQGVRQ